MSASAWSVSLRSFRIMSGNLTFRLWAQVLGVALLANLVVAGLWTYPSWRAVEPERRELERIADAREMIGPALARARATYGCILEAEQDLAVLRGRVASRSGTTAEAVEAIRRMVADGGLSATEVTYQREAIDELGLVELQAKLPVTGSYRSVRELISALGTDGPFVAIDRIALNAPDEASPRGPLSVELALSVFVAEPSMSPPESSMPPPERPIPPSERATSPPEGSPPPEGSKPPDSSTSPAESSASPAERPGGPDGPTAAGAGADPDGARFQPEDPWAAVEGIEDRLASLRPLPVAPSRYTVHLPRLDSRLEERPSADGGVSRNLFAFQSPPPGPRSEPPAAPEPPAIADPAPEEPSGPEVPFELVGIVDMTRGRRAILTDGRGLYVVGVGEPLPGGIEVVSVGIDYAELEVGGTRVRLDLEDETP